MSAGSCWLDHCDLPDWHEGSHEHVEKDGRWLVVVDEEKRCARHHCPVPAVAKLKRPTGWFGYCEDHLEEYGREVRDGDVIFCWEGPAAPFGQTSSTPEVAD